MTQRCRAAGTRLASDRNGVCQRRSRRRPRCSCCAGLRNRWRTAALVVGALAAGFAAVSFDHLFEEPREAGAAMSRLSIAPAISLRSSSASISRTRTVFVRPVATSVPQGHSLELWYIGNIWRRSRWASSTRSIAAFRCRKARPSRRRNFAVTVEPPGGSPSRRTDRADRLFRSIAQGVRRGLRLRPAR